MAQKFGFMNDSALNVEARLVTFNILVKRYKNIPVDVIQEIVDSLPCKEIQENFGIDLNPKILKGRNENNLLRIEGIGDLFDVNPDAYTKVLEKLQEGILITAAEAANELETDDIADNIADTASNTSVNDETFQMDDTDDSTDQTSVTEKSETPKLSEKPNIGEIKGLIDGFIRSGKTIIMFDDIISKYPKAKLQDVTAIIEIAAKELNYVFDAQLNAIYSQ